MLRRALVGQGFEVRPGDGLGRADRADLEAVLGGQHFVIELKAAGRNRSELLHGLAAASLMQARRHAATVPGAIALPIVAVTNVTDRTEGLVREWMEREAPGAAWGLMGSDGELVLRGLPGIEAVVVRRGPSRPRLPRKHELDPFTDLGQWMAKVLLAPRFHGAERRFLSAPRVPIRRARHLAQAAKVSEPTSARWVKLMRERGFLEDGRYGLSIVRTREFLEQWRRANGAVPRREVAARFVLPSAATDQQLHAALARVPISRQVVPEPEPSNGVSTAIEWNGDGPRACLALFEAASALGGRHVIGAPIHFYLESITDASLAAFGLVRASSQDGQVRVIEPTRPESVFRAMVLARTKHEFSVPTCDILQTWLDVSDHPARGREQADEIERSVLSKTILAEPDDADDA
ncbi:MAG: hypothetical protein NTV21_09690 [Planctomycetota bacterium]|nr:hypothetical protein [Planctomycetota bacterium]